MIPLPGEKIKLKGRSVRSSEIPLTYDDVLIMESSDVSKPTVVRESEIPNPANHLEVDNTSDGNSAGNENEKSDEIKEERPGIDMSKAPVVAPRSETDESTTAHSNKEKWINYEVVKGDTMYKISKQFNTSVQKIKELNQLESDTIKIGQILKISI